MVKQNGLELKELNVFFSMGELKGIKSNVAGFDRWRWYAFRPMILVWN
jgi:hypothetical protein